MKLLIKCVFLVALAAAAGCGNDAASDANKKLKPIDPNAPKPSGAGSAGPGDSKAGGSKAGAEVVK